MHVSNSKAFCLAFVPGVAESFERKMIKEGVKGNEMTIKGVQHLRDTFYWSVAFTVIVGGVAYLSDKENIMRQCTCQTGTVVGGVLTLIAGRCLYGVTSDLQSAVNSRR